MDTVLLALKLLRMLAFLAVVDLERVIVACHNGKLARVVKVQRGDRRGRTGGLEALRRREQLSGRSRGGGELTREGRKLAMTSLTLCVCGPDGGAGAPGVPEPDVAMVVGGSEGGGVGWSSAACVRGGQVGTRGLAQRASVEQRGSFTFTVADRRGEDSKPQERACVGRFCDAWRPCRVAPESVASARLGNQIREIIQIYL